MTTDQAQQEQRPLQDEGSLVPGGPRFDPVSAFLESGDEYWQMLMRSSMTKDEQTSWVNAMSYAVRYRDHETAHALISLLVLSSAEEGSARKEVLQAVTYERRPPERSNGKKRGGLFSRFRGAAQQEMENG